MRRLLIALPIAALLLASVFAHAGSAAPSGSANLKITKSDSPDPARVGSNLTYTIGVENLGPVPATGVTVTDNLPKGVDFVSATGPAGPCAVQGGKVTCGLGALDPVGVNVMRDVFVDLRRQGKTVVLSSHQMETVERLCDAIALIHRGRKVLDGPVSEVRSRHGKNTVVLSYEGDGAFLASLPGVLKVNDFGRYVEIKMAEGGDPQAILREAAARLRVSRFEVVEPSLHDIFVEQVTASGEAAA